MPGPTRQEMLELVDAHAKLDERMDTAIWIKQSDREAWLLEIIPSMSPDEHPERPVSFNPGRFFRHPLNWIGINRDDLEKVIRNDAELAQAIADGDILYGPAMGREIVILAREIIAHGHVRAS